MNIFWGMKILWIFLVLFGGYHKIGLYLGVASMHFWSFFKAIFNILIMTYCFEGQGTEWGILFGVAKNFNLFLRCLKFLIFLGVNVRCWARAYVWRKNESTPPPPHTHTHTHTGTTQSVPGASGG